MHASAVVGLIRLEGSLVNITTDIFVAVVQDFCQWQTFNGTCPTGSVIVIEHALYGRMRFNRCLDRSYGHVGCSTSVQRYLERRCAGRRTCLISLPDQYLDEVPTSCPSDLKAYLELSYHCLEGKRQVINRAVGHF